MIKDLIFNEKLGLFERLVKIYPKNPAIILNVLLETSLALKRDGKEIENFLDGDYDKIHLLFPDGTSKGICIPLSYE